MLNIELHSAKEKILRGNEFLSLKEITNVPEFERKFMEYKHSFRLTRMAIIAELSRTYNIVPYDFII